MAAATAISKKDLFGSYPYLFKKEGWAIVKEIQPQKLSNEMCQVQT
jgi:hypothetical protein